MKILIPRPDDPEMAKQWDEAREAIVQRDVKPSTDPDCCVGDRSRCRCAPERGGWTDEDTEREKWLAVWAGEG